MPDNKDILAALDQILVSPIFSKHAKQAAFLHFVVECSLSSSGPPPSSLKIATSCFKRTLSDPNDAYVRNIASQTRKSLKCYYDSLPQTPRVVIQLAERGYNISFQLNSAVAISKIQNHTLPKPAFTRDVTPKLLPTIAVIPLRCASGNSEHAVLGYMLSDSLITSLAKSKYMRVISRRTSAQFDLSEHSTMQLGEMLNADYIVEGQFHVHKDALRVRVEISSCSNDEVIWAEQLRSEVDAVISETDSLVDQILFGVTSQLLNHELQRALSTPLASLQCHSLLIGSINIMHRGTQTDITRAKEMLELLNKRNPNHATPYAHLAYWGMLNIARDADFCGTTTTKKSVSNHTNQALNIDSQHPVALMVSGMIRSHFDGDFLSAKVFFEQAIRSSANEAAAMGRLAVAQLYTESAQTASLTANRAIQTSPFDPELYFFYSAAATAAFGEKNYDSAIASAEESRKLFPNHPSNLRTLIGSYTAKGDSQSAEQHKQRLLQIEPSFSLANYTQRSPFPQNEIIQRLTRFLEISGLPVCPIR